MNALEIQMLGMSRSGNHAIADWIYAQAEGSRLLLNCAEGGTNPFLSCRPLSEGKGWRADRPFDFEAARQGQHLDRDLLMHTYEDSWISHVFSNALREHHDAWLGGSRRKVAMLVLRDPFNLFASRRKMGCGLPPDIARGIWKQHAREALGATQYLPANKLVVLYNAWKDDRSYRERIAQELGLRFSDKAVDRVPVCGGGSSFDGTEFDGNAAAMATGRRWVHFAQDERFSRFFDREMASLSEQLFDMAPPPALQLAQA